MAIRMRIGAPIENEPKRPNRFTLEFGSDEFIEYWLVQTVGAPKYSNSSQEIKFMNTQTYVAGIFKWDPIQIKLLDLIGPSGSQKLMEWVRLHSEEITGRQGYAAGYKKDLYLNSLDPTGVPIERWLLKNCMITQASFGDDRAYGTDAIQMVTMTVQPDYCTLLY